MCIRAEYQIKFTLICLMLASVYGTPYIRQYGDTTTEKSECCEVQKCSRVNLGVDYHDTVKCYPTRVCGRECQRTFHKKVLIPFSNARPLYRRIDNITVRTCSHEGVCAYQQYDCRQICPDPSQAGFDISRLTQTCQRCYDRI